MINSVNQIPDPPKRGGGMFGSVLGGLAGLALGAATGGLGAAAAPALAGAGAGIGAAGGVAAGTAAGTAAGAGLGAGLGGAGLGGALTGALSGLGMGQTAGGMLGAIADPASPGGVAPSVQSIQTKQPALNYMLKMPEVQLASMQNAKDLLSVSDLPNADTHIQMLSSAQDKLKKRMGSNSSIQGWTPY